MKRLLAGVLMLAGLSVTLAVMGSKDKPLTTHFPSEKRNPVTHLRWNDDPRDFQFAIVSDRTGGHRANVFSQAVEKLNLLQPEFVISVGDLIEGSTNQDRLEAEWQEFDGFVKRLEMPFFYVSGNHDVGNKVSDRFWQDRLGRRHYHFLYRDVLFLILNSDDPPGSGGAISAEQADFARQVLKDNADVRWTIVLLHRPLWTANNGEKNGWREVELALKGRRYTVFAGHVHRYQKFERQGMNYYQLATTGGNSRLRGPEVGEFDHIAWVTMKKDGPLLANVRLEAIQTEDLQTPQTDEPGSKRARKPTFAVQGKAFFQGTPMTGAQIVFHAEPDGAKRRLQAVGVVEADGSFQLSTYRANDGAPVGEYDVTITWRQRDRDNRPTGPSLLPTRYGNVKTSGLKATVTKGANQFVLELQP